MSRIGKEKVVLPAGVTFDVDDNNNVVVKGPKGEIKFSFSKNMKFSVDGNIITVERPDDSIQNKALHGTTRALLHNMVVGVNEGFKKTLLIEGVGYRASLQGNKLVVAAGYSHLVEMEIPTGIKVECPTQTQIDITGFDKQLVGEFAANVRKIRKPEHMNREGKVWIRIFPHIGFTRKPLATRMGGGKGSPEGYVAVVKKGTVMFEIAGVSEEIAREAMRLAANKLPIKTKFVKKEDSGE